MVFHFLNIENESKVRLMSFLWVGEEFVKQEIEPMTEYADEDKQYQTEGDEEIGTYESGSQENGKIRVEKQRIESAKRE